MPRCKRVDCRTNATFGFEWKAPVCCQAHVEAGMQDVVNKRCAECDKRPKFGFDKGKPTHCVTHKKEGMQDVVNKRCAECETQSKFGFDKGKPTHCVTHKKEGMQNVVSKRCAECVKSPKFGFNKGKPTHCVTHKKEGMQNVVSKRCAECEKQPHYGFDKGKPTHCVTHKKEGMQDVASKRCAECEKQPNYGFDKGKRTHCATHKKEGMQDVVSKRCSMCCDTTANPRCGKAPLLCMRCFVYSYLDHKLGRCAMVKERHVAEALQQGLPPDIHMVFNQQVSGGCSRRRPDILIDCKSHSIIVECDEDRHSSYECSCENRRLMELFVDLGSRPLAVVRINPDAYEDRGGVKHTSCFAFDGNGLPRIKPSKTQEWAARCKVLVQCVRSHMYDPPGRDVDITHLFYDGS